MWLPIYRAPLVFTDKSKGCFGWFFNVRVSLRDFFFFFFSLHKGIFTKCEWSDHTIKPCLLNKFCITLHICSYVTSCVFTAQVNTSACLKYFSSHLFHRQATSVRHNRTHSSWVVVSTVAACSPCVCVGSISGFSGLPPTVKKKKHPLVH